MKSLKELKKDNSITYFFTPDYKTVFPLDISAINYESRIDLSNGMFYEEGEVSDCPTLHELLDSGKLMTSPYVYYYTIKSKKYTNSITKKIPDMLSEKEIKTFIDEFKEHGINVTEKAIKHNYAAWKEDVDSGYRDEENQYHLSTPCGCYPLTFNAVRLDDLYKKSQKTFPNNV